MKGFILLKAMSETEPGYIEEAMEEAAEGSLRKKGLITGRRGVTKGRRAPRYLAAAASLLCICITGIGIWYSAGGPAGEDAASGSVQYSAVKEAEGTDGAGNAPRAVRTEQFLWLSDARFHFSQPLLDAIRTEPSNASGGEEAVYYVKLVPENLREEEEAQAETQAGAQEEAQAETQAEASAETQAEASVRQEGRADGLPKSSEVKRLYEELKALGYRVTYEDEAVYGYFTAEDLEELGAGGEAEESTDQAKTFRVTLAQEQ